MSRPTADTGGDTGADGLPLAPARLDRPSVRRGEPGASWPPPSGRVATHLGWLAREPWPRTPALAPDALGAAVARAARGPISVERLEQTWVVRDPVAALCDGLQRLGLDVVQPDPGQDAGGGLRFAVCPPDALGRLADALAQAPPACLVVVGVAREGDLAASLPHLRRLPAVACTDPALVALLQAAGTPALLWNPVAAGRPDPGPVDDPLIAGLPRAARAPLPPVDVWAERPLDIVSLGPEEAVRADLLGAGASALARRACVIVHRRALWRLPHEPILAEPTAAHLFRRARVVLNVNPGDASALDWSLGVLDAMARGAVAVSTPCFPHPFLHKDVHYLEETPDRLLQLVDWLLDTAEGRRTADAVRCAAARALAAEAGPARMAARLLQHALAAEPARA